jgi:hypothetical protein
MRPRSHTNPSSLKSKSHRANWIRQLVGNGKQPIITILEKLDSRELLSPAEIKWIAYGKTNEWPLTNITDGGEGSGPRPDLAAIRKATKGLPGRIQTQAEKDKRRLTLFGNKRGSGNKGVKKNSVGVYNISIAQRRRHGAAITRINLLKGT